MNENNMRGPPEILVSVVSHRQGRLVSALLDDLRRCCSTPLRIVVTLNVPEDFASVPELDVVLNPRARGFGANHNAAFRRAQSRFFCTINPDVRLTADPFPQLVSILEDQAVAVAAPRITDTAGRTLASARRYPTPLSILKKVAGREDLDYDFTAAAVSVDWVSGMFMLFRSDAFTRVNGFDERYFLYYEDVDICRRLKGSGYGIRVEPRCAATHQRQGRDWRRIPRHLASMIRFFASA